MSGERDLQRLLAALTPKLTPGCYVFTVVPGGVTPEGVLPFATVLEAEGLTLVLRQEDADTTGLPYDYVAARITLQNHSDLAAVGLTAVVSTRLAAEGISCNVIAGYFHDHLLVPYSRAADALILLEQLTGSADA